MRKKPKWLGEICSIKECDKSVYSRGICITHYQYMKLGRDLLPLKKIASSRESKKCIIDGCSSKQYGLKEFCFTHYKEARHIKSDTRKCEVPGCDGSHLARGYCELHYNIWKVNKTRFEIQMQQIDHDDYD